MRNRPGGIPADAVPGVDDRVQLVLDAFTAMAGEDDEDGALERAIDCARLATRAVYGAALLTADGVVSHLVHAGMTTNQVGRLPALPQGLGVLGAVLAGEVVNLDRLGEHPSSVGLPAHHPPMRAFLGVPVATEDATGDVDVVGALYLAKPPGHPSFDDADEALVVALARQCGQVVVRLRALRSVRDLAARLESAEGVRTAAVARMTEGLDPAEAVDRVLDVAREQLRMPLAALMRVHEGGLQVVERVSGAFEDGPADQRPAAGGVMAGDTLCRRVLSEEISVVPDLTTRPDLAAAVATSPAVRAYAGARVVVRGRTRGTLCTLSDRPSPLTPGDAAVLGVLADIVGRQLERREEASRLRSRREEALAPYLVPGGLGVALQPVVRVADGAVLGVEALARPAGWAGGPADLFSEAARAGLGVAMELAAVDAALAVLPSLPDDVQLGLNVGPATACDARLVERLRAAGARRGRLVVELTEHEDVSTHPRLRERLQEVRDAGALVAIDDAGAGYAGLRTIVDLSPDVLKLDVALVRGVDVDTARRSLIRVLVSLAEDLGSYLVAEGVETSDELAALRDLGVTAVQGFHLARPAPLTTLDLRRRLVVPATVRVPAPRR